MDEKPCSSSVVDRCVFVCWHLCFFRRFFAEVTPAFICHRSLLVCLISESFSAAQSTLLKKRRNWSAQETVTWWWATWFQPSMSSRRLVECCKCLNCWYWSVYARLGFGSVHYNYDLGTKSFFLYQCSVGLRGMGTLPKSVEKPSSFVGSLY